MWIWNHSFVYWLLVSLMGMVQQPFWLFSTPDCHDQRIWDEPCRHVGILGIVFRIIAALREFRSANFFPMAAFV
jgi:hypothetical protein